MKLTHYKLIIGFLFFTLITANVIGVDYTWDNGGDGTSWNDDSNWDDLFNLNRPDGNDDTATIDSSSPTVSSLGSAVTIGSLTINDAGATLNLDQDLTIDDTNGENGSFTLTNGTFDDGGNSTTIYGDLSVAAGSFTVSGTLVVQGNFTVAAGTFNNTGSVNFDGTTNLTSNANNLGAVVITAGNTVTLQDDLTCDSLTVNGTLNTNGQNLNVNGLTSIGAAGTLTAGAGNITVQNNVTITAGGVYTKGSGLFIIDGPVTLTSTTEDMGDIQINTGNTLTLADDLDCDSMDVQGTGILDAATNNVDISAAVNWSIAAGASFNEGTGTLIFDGEQRRFLLPEVRMPLMIIMILQ